MFKFKNQFPIQNICFYFVFLFLFLFIKIQKIYAYPLLDQNTTGIYTEFQEFPDFKANVIITHGIAESSKEYEQLKNFLIENNYNVLLYDIRSHGESINNSDHIADIESFHTFIDDLHLIVNSVKQKNNLPIILLGHSLGGMINNCYVYKYNDIDGVINSGTPTKIIDAVNSFINEQTIQNMSNIEVGANYERLCHSPLTLRMKRYRSVKFVTPRFVRNTMVLSIQYFRTGLNDNAFFYPTPLLLLHGLEDQVILPENSQEIFSIINNSEKILKLYPDMYHNIFREHHYELVFVDILDWLTQNF